MINNIKIIPKAQEKPSIVKRFCDKIKLNKSEECMSNISTTPTIFSKEEEHEEYAIVQSAKDVVLSLMRVSDNILLKFFESQRGQELLEKANEYNIPYNKEDTDFIKLDHEIAYYETLLEEADENGIDWDLSEYDPTALEQEIDYHERLVTDNQRQLLSDFFASRGV